MSFKVGDTTTTRDGKPARIICVDRKDSELPVLALITYARGDSTEEGVSAYTAAGRIYLSGEDGRDLMPTQRLEDLAMDTPILVQDREDRPWTRRYLAKVTSGRATCWNSGATSWSAADPSDTSTWAFWKLP